MAWLRKDWYTSRKFWIITVLIGTVFVVWGLASHNRGKQQTAQTTPAVVQGNLGAGTTGSAVVVAPSEDRLKNAVDAFANRFGDIDGRQQKELNHHEAKIGDTQKSVEALKGDHGALTKRVDGVEGTLKNHDGRLTTIEKRKPSTVQEFEKMIDEIIEKKIPKSTVPVSEFREHQQKVAEETGAIRQLIDKVGEQINPLSSAQAALAPVPAQVAKLSTEHGAIKAELKTHDAKITTLEQGHEAQEEDVKKLNTIVTAALTAGTITLTTTAPAQQVAQPSQVEVRTAKATPAPARTELTLGEQRYKEISTLCPYTVQGEEQVAQTAFLDALSRDGYTARLNACQIKVAGAAAPAHVPEPAPTVYEQRGDVDPADEAPPHRVAGPVYASGYGVAPAMYAGDRKLDSLGPHGRVLNRIKSPGQLDSLRRRCGQVVVARGVRGFAVSHACMCQHGVQSYCH